MRPNCIQDYCMLPQILPNFRDSFTVKHLRFTANVNSNCRNLGIKYDEACYSNILVTEGVIK